MTDPKLMVIHCHGVVACCEETHGTVSLLMGDKVLIYPDPVCRKTGLTVDNGKPEFGDWGFYKKIQMVSGVHDGLTALCLDNGYFSTPADYERLSL